MDQQDIQQQFFQHIKKNLPQHLSLVDTIAELLEISNDSAYRRIRGEKQLSFEEIKKLCTRFNISVDQMLNLKTDAAIFNGHYITSDNFMNEYLQDMLKSLQQILAFPSRELYYMCKDIPIFLYYMFPELAAFKYFIWMKTLLQYQQYTHTKFTLAQITEPIVSLGKSVAELYIQIPTHEIMNVDNIMTTLRQVEYYKEANLFASDQDYLCIYDKLDEMINHMERQTEVGFKFMPGQSPNSKSGSLQVYINDFVVGDNTNLAIVNGNKICFVNHNVINFINTRDQRFTDYTHQFLQNIIKKSMMISVVGERERTRFFNLMRNRINICRNNQFESLGKV